MVFEEHLRYRVFIMVGVDSDNGRAYSGILLGVW
jgi:hypothetical protein